MPNPQAGDYRCEATMSDGSCAVLFASNPEPSPAAALQLALATWRAGGQEPIAVRIFGGHTSRPVSEPLVEWRS